MPRSCLFVPMSACLDVCEVFGCFSYLVAGTPPFLVSLGLPASAEIVKYLTSGSQGKFLYFCGAK